MGGTSFIRGLLAFLQALRPLLQALRSIAAALFFASIQADDVDAVEKRK